MWLIWILLFCPTTSTEYRTNMRSLHSLPELLSAPLSNAALAQHEKKTKHWDIHMRTEAVGGTTEVLWVAVSQTLFLDACINTRPDARLTPAFRATVTTIVHGVSQPLAESVGKSRFHFQNTTLAEPRRRVCSCHSQTVMWPVWKPWLQQQQQQQHEASCWSCTRRKTSARFRDAQTLLVFYRRAGTACGAKRHAIPPHPHRKDSVQCLLPGMSHVCSSEALAWSHDCSWDDRDQCCDGKRTAGKVLPSS